MKTSIFSFMIAFFSTFNMYAQCVTIYEHKDYQGSSTEIFCNNRALGWMNDKTSSIKIPAGWRVIVYEHADYTGQQYGFTSSEPHFGHLKDERGNLVINDKVSSIRIFDASGKELTTNEDCEKYRSKVKSNSTSSKPSNPQPSNQNSNSNLKPCGPFWYDPNTQYCCESPPSPATNTREYRTVSKNGTSHYCACNPGLCVPSQTSSPFILPPLK